MHGNAPCMHVDGEFCDRCYPPKEEKKRGVYFLMPDEKPNIYLFLRMAHELFMLGFDDNRFQRVMILNPAQMSSFLSSVSQNMAPLPTGNFHTWQFAGFMLRTLHGKIE